MEYSTYIIRIYSHGWTHVHRLCGRIPLLLFLRTYNSFEGKYTLHKDKYMVEN